MSDRALRRATLRRQKERFFARMLVFLLIAAAIGSGLVIFNTSRLLLSDRNNMTAYVPDTVLVDSPGSALVMLTDQQGNPVVGESVVVEVEKDNQVVWSAATVTDFTGLALLPFNNIPNLGDVKVVVTGAGESISKEIKIETSTRIFLQTDKPIYQPVQVVHIRTLAFSGLSPTVSTENVTLDISTPEGDRIFRKTLVPDEYGIASYDYSLGKRLPLGLYTIRATIGDESAEKAFGVQRYVLPRFVIDFRYMAGWYKFNRQITGQLCVNYVFGEVVHGTATIVPRIYTGEWYDLDSIYEGLSNGCMMFQIPAINVPNQNAGGYLELKAVVTDTAGHSETKTKNIPLSNTPILITALTDTNVPGSISNDFIIARWPDGMPVVNATVEWYSNGDKRTTTDSRGVAQVSFYYSSQSTMQITVEKGEHSSTLTLYLRPEPGIKVFTDKSHYEVGETANVDIRFSGESLTNWVYYEVVARNFIISANQLTMTGYTASFTINIDRSYVPLTEVRVYKILLDMTVSRDNVMFTVGNLSELQVDITADQQQYRPGEDVTLDFFVSDNSMPTAAALGITIVDMAVYEVDERFIGLEQAFVGEEESVPYDAQVINYVFGTQPISFMSSTPLVVEQKSALADDMQSSLPAAIQHASEQQESLVSYYWYSLLLIGMIGFFGLLLIGLRNKKYRALAVALMIVVPATIAMGYLYANTYASSLAGYRSNWFFSGGLVGAGSTVPGDRDILTPGAPEVTWGTIPLGGDPWSYDDGTRLTTLPIAPPARIRTFFPETWYWNPSLIVGPDGRANITIPAPDSITTWAVDAMASTKDARLGSGNSTVLVFQDFFVEPDIPVVAVQNDTFDLLVSVFNYLDVTNPVTIQLQTDTWFTLTGPSMKQLVLQANTVNSTYFTITANDLGEHNVTIFAGNMLISDAVSRVIRVEPRGKLIEETFNGRLTSNDVKSITLTLRDDRVFGSEYALVKIQPSITAAVLDGAENYIHYVSGCGEQSLSTLSVDVVAFQLVSEDTSEQRMSQLEQIVNQGIQHEMQFVVPAGNGQGRGIVWFPGHGDVHPWLTSWGLITFQDAIDTGFGIDEKIIEDLQKWLISIQQEDGSWIFQEWGSLANPLLRTKQIAGTAYIARALLHSGRSSTDPAIQKAVNYIEANVQDNWDNSYVLALSLIVLADGDGSTSLRSSIVSRLNELKYEDNSTYYWKATNSILSDGNVTRPGYWGEYDSRTSETTGYAIMALHKEMGATNNVIGGVEYLLNKRNSYGGWWSTQDTVVSFEALITVGGEWGADSLDVTVRVGGPQVGSMLFDQTTQDMTYFLDITANLMAATTVEISTTGSGSVIYQVVLGQYIPWEYIVEPPCELCFSVAFSSTNIRRGETVTATVNLEYTGELSSLRMVLVSINSGVGLRFDTNVLDSLIENGTISLYELNPNSVLLYVQDLQKDVPLNFDVVLEGSIPFQGTIEGSRATDLYDPSLTHTVQPIEMTVTR